MFDNITAAPTKTRRGTSTLVSLLLHGAAIGLAVAFTYVRAHMPKTETPVEVVFRPPPPPPPPPPPAARKPKTPRQTPKIVPKTRPTQIVQPKELPKMEEKPPEDLPEVPEDEPDEGVEGGVEGGVVGGVVGGSLGGTGTGPPPKRIEADNSVVKMVLLSGPKPDYTPQALEHEVHGVMVVKCLITIDGTVHNCRVQAGLPFLDRSTVAALEQQRYKPYILNGQPVEVDLTFRIRFDLPP